MAIYFIKDFKEDLQANLIKVPFTRQEMEQARAFVEANLDHYGLVPDSFFAHLYRVSNNPSLSVNLHNLSQPQIQLGLSQFGLFHRLIRTLQPQYFKDDVSCELKPLSEFTLEFYLNYLSSLKEK